jgi:hypothetical protein
MPNGHGGQRCESVVSGEASIVPREDSLVPHPVRVARPMAKTARAESKSARPNMTARHQIAAPVSKDKQAMFRAFPRGMPGCHREGGTREPEIATGCRLCQRAHIEAQPPCRWSCGSALDRPTQLVTFAPRRVMSGDRSESSEPLHDWDDPARRVDRCCGRDVLRSRAKRRCPCLVDGASGND